MACSSVYLSETPLSTKQQIREQISALNLSNLDGFGFRLESRGPNGEPVLKLVTALNYMQFSVRFDSVYGPMRVPNVWFSQPTHHT